MTKDFSAQRRRNTQQRNELLLRSCKALLAGAQAASPSIVYVEHDRAPHWNDNLLVSLRGQPDIKKDLESGAGKELEGKFCSAHSSSALVVNTFGPWRTNPSSLKLLGNANFRLKLPRPTVKAAILCSSDVTFLLHQALMGTFEHTFDRDTYLAIISTVKSKSEPTRSASNWGNPLRQTSHHCRAGA
jgi:hypothetical protein